MKFANGTTSALNERQKVLIAEEKLMGNIFTYYKMEMGND